MPAEVNVSAAIEEELTSLERREVERHRALVALHEQLRAADAKLAESAEELVNAILDRFERVSAIADKVCRASAAVRQVWAPKVLEHYRQLAHLTAEVSPTVKWALQQGYPISRAGQFWGVARDCQMLATNADRWLNGMKQLDEKRGVPLQEAMDELRRRARAGCD